MPGGRLTDCPGFYTPRTELVLRATPLYGCEGKQVPGELHAGGLIACFRFQIAQVNPKPSTVQSRARALAPRVLVGTDRRNNNDHLHEQPPPVVCPLT